MNVFSTKKDETYFYLEKPFLENVLYLPIIFVLFLKGKKITKKTLNVTPNKKMHVREKSSLGLGVRLLIEKVRWKRNTPLSS